MENGKLPENMLKRSVLKNITGKSRELVSGAGVGRDSSVLQTGDGMCAVSGGAYELRVPSTEQLAVCSMVNNLAASGAEAKALWMNLLLPVQTQEQQLKEVMRGVDAACNRLGIALAGGHTQVSDAVDKIFITGTGIGSMTGYRPGKVKPGMDIVITKWIGLGGTWLLARYAHEKLRQRLSEHFLLQAEQFGEMLCVAQEATIGLHNAVCMHDASNGGIFGALWELAQQADTGLEVDLRRIPVRQETIEICEQLQLNPYQLNAAGSLLIISEEGHHLVNELKRAGIPAVVAGCTTPGNDRVLLNEDERRFLEPPKQDELYKVL